MSNATNTQGRTTSGSMEAFDRLPKALRSALANADHNWSGEQLLRARRRKHPSVRTISDTLAFLKAQDKRMHEELAAQGLIPADQR
jgi:hypothetical protein